MRILSCETSTRHASVAVLEDRRSLSERSLPREQKTAVWLVPTIQELLAEVGWSSKQVDLVAVSIGPGSFTGLRLGVATAKVFAYATGCSLRGIRSLDVLAHQADTSGPVEAVMDAQRGEFYWAAYAAGGPGIRQFPVSGPTLRNRLQWLSGRGQAGEGGQIAVRGPETTVTGPVLLRWPEVPPGCRQADSSRWVPRAAALGELAWYDAEEGRFNDPWKLAPVYLRPSAAEERAAQNPSNR